MQVLDRVKLLEDMKMQNGVMLKRDTVGTCRYINPETKECTVQIGLPLDDSFISSNVILSDLILETVSGDDLSTVEFEYITAPIYHPGNIWSIKQGYDEFDNIIYKSYLIRDYILAVNEANDEVLVNSIEDLWNNRSIGTKVEDTYYKVRYLEKFGSYSTIIDLG